MLLINNDIKMVSVVAAAVEPHVSIELSRLIGKPNNTETVQYCKDFI